MLTIRNVQMRVFEGARWKDFENRAVTHIRSAVPADYQRLGEGAVRESVKTAIAECGNHGIRREIDILTYLNVMYVLGFDFAHNPAYRWADEVLNSARLRGAAKAQVLLNRCRRELAVS